MIPLRGSCAQITNVLFVLSVAQTGSLLLVSRGPLKRAAPFPDPLPSQGSVLDTALGCTQNIGEMVVVRCSINELYYNMLFRVGTL